MIYAYARVSSRDQNLTRQLEAFKAFGVEKQNIYCDKKSGKKIPKHCYICACQKGILPFQNEYLRFKHR